MKRVEIFMALCAPATATLKSIKCLIFDTILQPVGKSLDQALGGLILIIFDDSGNC